MKQCKEQVTYNRTLREYTVAAAKRNAHEKAFMATQSGALDRCGRPARYLYQVADVDLFDELETKYQADPVSAELWKAYADTRTAFLKAERELIDFALSIVPASVRATLAPAAKNDPATRQKVIDLALRLDVSTIPGCTT